ncbi:MAG: hypothetical protein AABZ10_06200 [Nitrospirota bacterium]
MKTNLKQKFLRTVMGGTVALLLLSAPNAFAFPSRGTCAVLITAPVPVGATFPRSEIYNVLGKITFNSDTTATIDLLAVGAQYTENGVSHGTDEFGSGLLVDIIAGGLGSPESKTLTFIRPEKPDYPVVINAYSVNGGRTILLQGASSPFSGVCQF